jgi:ketosteroid isomerase-like protein
MKKLVLLLLALIPAIMQAQTAPATTGGADAQKIWELERTYWRYVEQNDLAAYRGLWHQDFLGWPSVSPRPVRKQQITDWITTHADKGEKFQFVEFKPADVQVTGDFAMAAYWATFAWVKDGKGEPATVRITHAWRRIGHSWQIAGGMSMPEAAPPKP